MFQSISSKVVLFVTFQTIHDGTPLFFSFECKTWAASGGGSMRISDWKVQETILKDILKLDYSDLAYLVEALSYGAPVHGGIALGLDRSEICPHVELQHMY